MKTPAPQFGPGVYECVACKGKGKFIQRQDPKIGYDPRLPILAREVSCVMCEGTGYFRSRVKPMNVRQVA